MAVPFENRSNKLWFRLISAYNNMKEFDKAREELDKIEPFCDDPADRSRFHYMHGYIHYSKDREYLAIQEYRRGLDADPNNSIGLNLQDSIEDCRGYITQNLAKLHSLSERIYNDIRERCRKKPDKTKLSEGEFTLCLGFLPALRVIPGHEHAIGFNYFKKYLGEEKQAALDWLRTDFGITDRDSLLDVYQNDLRCNINNWAEDVRTYLAGNPRFNMDELNEEGRYAFDCHAEFIGAFNEFLPEAGVLAWDISEKMGLVRWAYACDLIPNTDFSKCMLYLHDFAREKFASVEEYILSLAFGAAVFVFKVEGLNIVHAIDFLARTAPLLKTELPDIEW